MFRAKNGESLGLTFTEILSPTESSILMYRNEIADLVLESEEISEEYTQECKNDSGFRNCPGKKPVKGSCA